MEPDIPQDIEQLSQQLGAARATTVSSNRGRQLFAARMGGDGRGDVAGGRVSKSLRGWIKAGLGLGAFLTHFARDRRLTQKELRRVRDIIDTSSEDDSMPISSTRKPGRR